MRADLSCYKEEALKANKVKLVMEGIEKTKGQKTSLLDQGLVERVSTLLRVKGLATKEEKDSLESKVKGNNSECGFDNDSDDDNDNDSANDDEGTISQSGSSENILSPLILEREIEGEKSCYQLKYGQNNIGRDASNNIILLDTHVSRLHAILLVHSDNRAVIFDLNSLNGISVNGEKLSEATLNLGDKIRLSSSCCLTFNSLELKT